MIKRILIFIIIITLSCSKENNTIRKIEGSWEIEYIEIYEPNYISGNPELVDSYHDAGTITFINNKKNKHRTDVSPYTNNCTLNWLEVPPASITDLYYCNDVVFWSLVSVKRNNISRLQLMVSEGMDMFYYSTYTIEWINENEIELYYHIDNSDGYDNSISYIEIWKLLKSK